MNSPFKKAEIIIYQANDQSSMFEVRIETIETKLIEHDQKFDMLIKSEQIPGEGIFYEGQVFDAGEMIHRLN